MIISRELLLRYIYLKLLKMQSEKTRYKKILVILFQNVNSHLADLDETDYQDITELCFYLLTGHKRKDINSSVFEIIYLYIKYFFYNKSYIIFI